jgi:AcrR family transcriptional regulator
VKRKLKLKVRAERQAETRARIIDAALALHTTVGPARTSISAIARRARVQRQTIYAHFADERSLLLACSAKGRARLPPPELAAFEGIADPRRRLRVALEQLYRYFRRGAGGWQAVLRDAEVSTLIREIATERRLQYLGALRDTLAAGWRLRDGRRRRLRAALGLAVDFRSWETLALKQGLGDRAAAALMCALVIGWVCGAGDLPRR